MKKIFFRVDSSSQIGSGHLMRCLELAERFKKRKVDISFICRDLEGNMIDLLEQTGYKTDLLPSINCIELSGYEAWLTVPQELDAKQTQDVLQGKRVDLLVVDHYALDGKWEEKMRSFTKKILVIDDLANRSHVCDFLWGAAYYPKIEQLYANRVPFDCRLFLGPQYFLLREEFYQAKKIRSKNHFIKNVLVYFGGSDFTNETGKVLAAISSDEFSTVTFHIVVGLANPLKDEIKSACESFKNIKYYCQINFISELMQRADFTIGAVGTSIWERCYLQLPSLVIAVAEHQENYVKTLKEPNLFCYLGRSDAVSSKDIADTVRAILQNRFSLNDISHIDKNFLPDENKISCMIDSFLEV